MPVEATTFLTLTRELIRRVHPTILKAVSAESRAPKIKSDGSLVTETDHAVEAFLTAEFERSFSGVPVLGEERAADIGSRGEIDPVAYYSTFMRAPQHIIMDPVDGTKNFVEGRPEFCVAIALTKRVGDGVWPHVGVVAVPVAGEMYWCDERQVFREPIAGGELAPVTRVPSEDKRVSINSKDRAWLKEQKSLINCPWVSSGSSVHDFLGTALGRLQGSMVRAQRLWDLMAPLAIAERLGCELIDFSTSEVIRAITPTELSSDLVNRPWGLTRRMMLLPKGKAISEVVST